MNLTNSETERLAEAANKYAHPIGSYSEFVDLMGSPNLGGKTMLYILDGL